MKLFNDDDARMGGEPPAQTGAARVHVVRPALTEQAGQVDQEAQGRVRPLQIEYSSTRVVGEALARLRRTHGIVSHDRSPLSESFRMLRNQVLQRMRADGHTLLAVTSPRSIEGKSMTAVNLALTMAADYDSAVLLVDADLSGRGLQSLFGLQGAAGLSDHLTEGRPLQELLVNPGVARLVLLPAGQQPVLNSSELLATRAAQQSIQEMKQRYRDRYVIVDLPPLLDTADALAFLPQADTTLLVVEEHTTAVQDVESASELLAPFPLIGTVMSQAREPEPGTQAPWYRRLWGEKRA